MQHGQMIVTKKGLALQSKVQAGFQKLKFTRVATGSGRVDDATALVSLEALVEYRQTIAINDTKVKDGTTAIVEAVLSNHTLDEGYYLTEIGVFAEDADEGEILYSVVNFGDQGDYMPAKTQRQVEVVLNLHQIVASTEHLEVTVDYSLVFVTKKEFYDLAGKGRTTENVKKNADDILALMVEVAALKGAALNNVNSNIFMVSMKKLTAEEEFEGYWNATMGRLEV